MTQVHPIEIFRPKRDHLAGRIAGCFIVVGSFSVLAAAFLAYSILVEPGWLQITTIEIPVHGLIQEADGLRLVQISDIHMTSWMNSQRLTRIVERVNALHPDIVVLTGDFVYGNPNPFLAGMTESLKGLDPQIAKLAVMGNHDYWSGVDKVRAALRDAGVLELRNSVYKLRIADNPVLNIGGVDDPWEGKDDIHQVINGMDNDLPSILLAHEPDFADQYSQQGKFFLQLSGHSHGGQVRLFGDRAIILPEYARKYPAGRYQVSSMALYTSRGVGAIPIHIRFNCRPEVTLFILRST